MTKKKVCVDKLFYQQEVIGIEEWHNDWHCCPIQRDHVERAKKSKHQKKFKTIKSDHLEVNGVILTKDCTCTETLKKYEAGTKFKTNGHTRDEYWWADYSSDEIPDKVRVSWKYVDTLPEVYLEYDMFDNPDDVEIASDRVDGAYRDVFGHRQISIKDGKLRKVEPIQYAALQCFPHKYDTKMKTSTTNIRLWVNDLEDPILWLKEIFDSKEFAYRDQTKLKHVNPFTLAYLCSYMKYRENEEALKRLREFILRVSNAKYIVDQEGEIKDNNPLNRFIEEWSQLSTGTSHYVFAAINGVEQSENMRSFCLLMIDKFVLGETISSNGRISWNWKGYLETWIYQFELEQQQKRVNVLNLVTSKVSL